MANIKTKVLEIWGKRNDLVKPVIGWSVFGGVLAVSIVLALIFWLLFLIQIQSPKLLR